MFTSSAVVMPPQGQHPGQNPGQKLSQNPNIKGKGKDTLKHVKFNGNQGTIGLPDKRCFIEGLEFYYLIALQFSDLT